MALELYKIFGMILVMFEGYENWNFES